jgi:hypothetical protein
LKEFVEDPKYSHILRHGLVRTKVETIKESKYRNPMDLVTD